MSSDPHFRAATPAERAGAQPRPWPLVDTFIPKEGIHFEYREYLYRARALVIVALADAISMSLVCFALFLARDRLTPLETAPLFLAVAAAGLFGIPFIMRHTGSLQIGGNLYGLSATLALLTLIAITGGMAQSPLVPWWPLIIFFCFLIAGWKTAVRWAAIGLALWLIATLSDTAGLTLSLLPDDTLEDSFRYSTVMAGLVMLAILWFLDFYQKSHLSRLQRERDNALFAAAHDPLTGLNNHKQFEQKLLRLMQHYRVAGGLHGLVLIDLDGFQGINDRLGHKDGDKLLMAIAGRLRQGIRHGDFCARLGGDKFGVLLYDLREPADLRPIVDKLHRAITTPTALDDGTEIAVGASMGVALLPEDGDSVESLLDSADLAMSRARANNQPYCFFGDIPRQPA